MRSDSPAWVTASSRRSDRARDGGRVADSGRPAIEGPDGQVVERRITTSGFPYAIRYRTIDEAIVVMAIYHQRRRPDFGTERSP